jgi:hypothetical protein
MWSPFRFGGAQGVWTWAPRLFLLPIFLLLLYSFPFTRFQKSAQVRLPKHDELADLQGRDSTMAHVPIQR